jgi:hypothetical protein
LIGFVRSYCVFARKFLLHGHTAISQFRELFLKMPNIHSESQNFRDPSHCSISPFSRPIQYPGGIRIPYQLSNPWCIAFQCPFQAGPCRKCCVTRCAAKLSCASGNISFVAVDVCRLDFPGELVISDAGWLLEAWEKLCIKKDHLNDRN